jgi:hypothetical protein
MIARLASDQRILKFGDQLLASAETARRIPPEMSNDSKVGPPLHEMSWSPLPTIPVNNPLGFLRLLATTAVEQRDLETYQLAVDRALNASALLARHIGDRRLREADLRATEVPIEYAISALVQIGLATRGSQERHIFAERFLAKTGVFLLDRGVPNYAATDYALRVLGGMALVSEDLLKAGNDASALVPVIVARQLATEGMGSEKETAGMQDVLVNHGLAACATIIKNLGEAAIGLGDTQFLYRCLDALGWLGCAAAREKQHAVGSACANGLVQLGRLARAKQLPCFWNRCALSPADHACERIEWIASWTCRLDEVGRGRWEERCRTRSPAFQALKRP